MSWQYTQSVNPSGYGIFMIHVRRKEADVPTDVTFFRDVPALINSMTYADPFGDATASIFFPQCTGFDGPYSNPPTNTVPTDTVWLQEFTGVDILWVPATTTPSDHPVVNPMTNSYGLYLQPDQAVVAWEGFIVSVDPSAEGTTVNCQGALYQLDRYFAKPLNPMRPKLVEEMIERAFDRRRRGVWTQPLEIDFTGWTKVYTMDDYNKFKTDNYGSLRYVPTGFTAWNDTTFSQQTGDKYAAALGEPWTGYVTRNTGSWERLLTGYVQGQLGILWAKPDNGSTLVGGDQWTITKKPGRKPYMYVRRQSAEPTVVAWYGQPGVDVRVTRDGAQNSNIVYGTGKAYQEAEWSTFTQPKGSWTAWEPLAQEGETYNETTHAWEVVGTPKIWHGKDAAWDVVEDNGSTLYQNLYDGYDAEYERLNEINVVERFAQFPDGVSQGDAAIIANNWIVRDSDPGWSGTITLQVDLRAPDNSIVSKWSIRDGDVILLKGFNGTSGTAVTGVNKFHISQVNANPLAGTVELTVDTKFRDLLTVEEAMLRGRDSLSPIKSLQVGKKSVLIQDLALPWDNKRSGYCPTGSSQAKITGAFPYEEWTKAHPPSDVWPLHPDFLKSQENVPTINEDLVAGSGNHLDEIFYVPVRTNSSCASDRWAFVQVPLSQAGTISRSEFAAYKRDGSLYPIEFHVSVWSTQVNLSAMPKEPDVYGAYADYSALTPAEIAAQMKKEYNGNKRCNIGVFWKNPVGKAFDQIRNDGTTLTDTDEISWYAGNSASYMIIGWGDYDNPCGYGNRLKTDPNATLTGTFADSSTWTYDFGHMADFVSNKENKKITSTEKYSVTIAFHVAQDVDEEYAYLMGRFFRKVEI